MKTQELRIGNLVGNMYENIAIIKSIYEDEIWSGGYYILTEENKSAISSLKPIPLTEEWLVKFGAEIDENGDKFIRHPTNLILRFYIVSGYIQLTKMGNSPMSNYKHIDKVHLFQNLYFALTGEELKLIS